MDAPSIAKLCIESADLYLEYLEKQNLGLAEVEVFKLKCVGDNNEIWEMHVRSKIYDIDAIQLEYRITGKRYKVSKDFHVKEYDSDTGLLIIKVVTEELLNQHNITSDEVKIISDLLFLVRNVKEWFLENGAYLKFPVMKYKQTIISSGLSGTDKPMPDQTDAISIVLSKPYCYIWGPPGTGKTWVILTQSTLQLIQNDLRVGIFAPTNLALEQAMDALIENASKLGHDKSIFLRLGSPTRKFAEKHPEVCEIQGIEKQIKEIDIQIDNLRRVLKYREGRNVLKCCEILQKILIEIGERVDALNKVETEQITLINQLKDIEKKQNRIFFKIKEIFLGNRLKEVQENILGNIKRIQENRSEILTGISLLENKFRNVEVSNDKLKKLQDELEVETWRVAQNNLSKRQDDIREYMENKLDISNEYTEIPSFEIEDRITNYERESDHLKKYSIKDRIEKCKIIGMTLDLYIGRFREAPLEFDHILLDECGYTSLIKALPLFRHGNPISMLGDHKQLPPIVEMDNEDLKTDHLASVRLWGAPSIYAQKMINWDNSEKDFLDSIYNPDNKQELKLLPSIYVKLKSSRRFGSNLCAILDDLFYQFGYSSALSKDLNITVFSTKRPSTNRAVQRRVSLDEAEVIVQILKEIDQSDFAIITPYRNQVKSIGSKFNKLRQEDRILTVHRSQGREWNTVIMSVVDGVENKPWFTDVNNAKSNGAKVMNTAVSRAKENLIIVCDRDFWMGRRDKHRQLIPRLIELAEQTEKYD